MPSRVAYVSDVFGLALETMLRSPMVERMHTRAEADRIRVACIVADIRLRHLADMNIYLRKIQSIMVVTDKGVSID